MFIVSLYFNGYQEHQIQTRSIQTEGTEETDGRSTENKDDTEDSDETHDTDEADETEETLNGRSVAWNVITQH